MRILPQNRKARLVFVVLICVLVVLDVGWVLNWVLCSPPDVRWAEYSSEHLRVARSALPGTVCDAWIGDYVGTGMNLPLSVRLHPRYWGWQKEAEGQGQSQPDFVRRQTTIVVAAGRRIAYTASCINGHVCHVDVHHGQGDNHEGDTLAAALRQRWPGLSVSVGKRTELNEPTGGLPVP